MTHDILLSIVIPTKNRQNTCISTIKSALQIDSNEVEIIVQDCSDDKSLEEQIKSEFPKEKRLKYQYNGNHPNMTKNWNDAISRAKGTYICAIGDDDFVLEEIFQITIWAMENEIEVVQHSNPYTYYWPDFSSKLRRGKLFSKHFSGQYNVNNEMEKTLISKSYNLNMSYMDGSLPLVYHSLLSSDFLKKIRIKTGLLLDGTCLDIYSAFVFGNYCEKLVHIDYPFTIRGACGMSNSNRINNNELSKHLNEYKNFNKTHIDIPKLNVLEYSIYESMKCAFINSKREDLLGNLNTEWLFGAYIFHFPLLFFTITKWYYKTKISNRNIIKLYSYTLLLASSKLKENLKESLKYYLKGNILTQNLVLKNSNKMDSLNTIIAFHKSYIKINKISLKELRVKF